MRVLATLALAVSVLVLGSSAPAGGVPGVAAAGPTVGVQTFELGADFKAPWQVAWIPSGSPNGLIAFTDRTGNAVGLFDPATRNTQRIPLTVVTSPGPIAVLDSTRFAVAGTGGVAIFDRTGTGRITQLAMANSRNQVLSVGANGNLFVADAQQHDLRIIRAPYSGPADITRFPLPQQCRNPTGLIPGATTIDVLCQQTNNIVRIDYTGNFGSATALPVANAGAQEARPSPTGFVFSGFNAGRFFSYSPGVGSPFKSFALTGPAVPTVGLFYDSAADRKLREAGAALRAGKRPTRAFFFNSFTPSFRGGGFALGSFPAASGRAFDRLAGRSLVGSTNGPGGSIWVGDATPGRPALHRISIGDGAKSGRTQTGYRFSQWLTRPDPGFVSRMTIPFNGPAPSEVRFSLTGASASPWNLGSTFTDNFGDLKAIVRGSLPGAGSYQVKVTSADTGPYTRAYQFGLRPRTTSLTLTFTGGSQIPASFGVDAVAEVKPCECDSLDVVLDVRQTSSQSSTLGFKWELECTGGAGPCSGTFVIEPDKAARAAGVRMGFTGRIDLERERGANGRVEATCVGNCANQSKGESYLLFSAEALGARFGDEISAMTIEVERICGSRERAPKTFKIAYGGFGTISKRRSDLNGNGIADGKEKR